MSVDMEGASCVVDPHQTEDCYPEDYAFGRRMQQHDALAAVRAALEAGADRIVVNDAHDRMFNLDVSAFPPEVEVISGSPKIISMTAGIEEGFDAAFFIAYHAMAGTECGVLDHTLCSKTIYDVFLNGHRMGETGINAALCGELGVPVALVTGDDAVCLESASLLGEDLVTCCVKEGLGRHAARCLPTEKTADLIEYAVHEAMECAHLGKSPCLKLVPPYILRVAFCHTANADHAALIPGAERVSGREVEFHSDHLFETRRFLSAVS